MPPFIQYRLFNRNGGLSIRLRALLQVRFYDESAAFGIDPNDNMTPANTATKALSPNVNIGPLKDQNMPAAALATKVAPPTANS
jgi:hypothetical protein